ncbi:serine/threonine protein kinase [Nocardiopsis sp. CNT-189]|uniref:serine/threonine-protein kinase n=1 Tax=Nocardiopsis oceanisediminis TaxID=2816862 RepID=UPI003B2B615A
MGTGRKVGGFRLVREIGSGGFGSVHLGEDSSGRQAAVKLLHPHLAKDARVRRYFARELDSMRQVQGFCLAEVLDADAEAARPWIATEYIKGPTLEEDVRDRGPRTGGELQRLAMHTITALNAIHAAGVVHRDLKPANILLGPDGPRVIDFGIARALDADTSSATRIGTLGYMAPEQLEGTALGPAADLFAWASVIVHAATGAEAFPGPTQAARINRVLTRPPETGDLAEPLLGIVLACTAKEPDQRPTARQVLDMLLTGRSAPPPAGGDAPTTEYTARAGGERTGPAADPDSWRSSDTDRTPFTVDALLPERFVSYKGIEFARVASGIQPCDLAATGEGSASAGEVVEKIIALGCTRLAAGVYTEQPGPLATAHNPVTVSVSVFPFPDKAKAVEMYEFLDGPAHWNLTTWRPQWHIGTLFRRSGPDVRPFVPGRKHFRWCHRRWRHRYLIIAMAYRADLTTDGGIGPWLEAAAHKAAVSSGPDGRRT